MDISFYMLHSAELLETQTTLINQDFRSIYFISSTINYISFRMQGNTFFQVSFILFLIHIRLPFVHQHRMVNIHNSIIYVMTELKKGYVFFWSMFWFKSINQIFIQVNIFNVFTTYEITIVQGINENFHACLLSWQYILLL